MPHRLLAAFKFARHQFGMELKGVKGVGLKVFAHLGESSDDVHQQLHALERRRDVKPFVFGRMGAFLAAANHHALNSVFVEDVCVTAAAGYLPLRFQPHFLKGYRYEFCWQVILGDAE
jgi:hypothetical protein